MTEETMSLVSWIHDHTYVENENYADDSVVMQFQATPSIVSQARSKAAELTPSSLESV